MVIEVALRGLKGKRVGGPPSICAEDLEGWIREAKREDDPENRRWELVGRLVQMAFSDGTVLYERVW